MQVILILRIKMIIVDTALERLEQVGTPIRVGMVGAGFMGGASAIQIIKYSQGMRLLAISSRDISKAVEVFTHAGVTGVETASTVKEFERVIGTNPIVTSSWELLCRSKNIDVILEMTGDVEFGASVAMEAINNGKHFVSFNAELFGTLGSILKKYADKAGVIFTLADGDQPVVQMNLFRFVKGLGVKPVLCGNIKGLHDPYRNPTTQIEFAKKWGQKPIMVSSFADGTKISFEQAVVANATGMRVMKRGMTGPTVTGISVEKASEWYPHDRLLDSSPGYVDYAVAATPGPGIYILGTIDDPSQKQLLRLYKLGDGPLYSFFTPYHLCHFEVPTTIARAFIFHDTALAPIGCPTVDVITAAKKDLKKGEKIDPFGGYATYGLCENYDIARKENLLPIGLAQDCVLKRDITKDQALTFDDVIIPEGRLSDKLWKEQAELYS
jgi:predicted homoserine dehydrogenase-like protein